jgi:hypothetical protein
MKKEKIYAIICENCIHSDSCVVLNSYLCNKFTPAIDSNYKYILDFELFEIEKQNFALYLL